MEIDFETIKKLKDCCLREATLRQRVYPKWVTMGRMTQEKAKEEIKLMSLAAACFNEILEKKAFEIQQHLFDLSQYQKQTHKRQKRLSHYDGY